MTSTRRQFLQSLASLGALFVPRPAQAEVEPTVAPLVAEPQSCPPGPDPRDAVGLPCASCGRQITRADASYERQQRADLRYPVVGRYLAWTHRGWVCGRCAHPAPELDKPGGVW